MNTGKEHMVLCANGQLAIVVAHHAAVGYEDAEYKFGDGRTVRLSTYSNFQSAAELRGPFGEGNQ